MIFANIFYFFSAIVIISFAPDKMSSVTNSSVTFPLNIIWIFVLVFLFINYNKNSFLRLKRKYDKEENNSLTKSSFNKLINSNMMLAVIVFSLLVFVFDLKFLLLQIPLIGLVNSLIDIILLTFFMLLLSIVWFWSYKFFKEIYVLGNSVSDHIKSNIKFNLAIIIPWFIAVILENISIFLNISFFNEIKGSIWEYILTMFVYLIILLIFTPYLITKLWESEPLDAGELKTSIDDYCQKQNVKFKGVLSWNALNKGLITAAVMGIIYPFRYLLLTPKLMELLNKDEILAVVGHEVGHVRKKHMFFYICFFFAAMPFLTSLSMYLVQLFQITEPGRSIFVFLYEPNNIFINVLIITLTLFFFIIYFRFFFAYLMRNFERQADLYCFESDIEPEHLISAFEKLNTIIREPKEKKNWHHFNISERVSFLKECLLDTSLIEKHSKKVRKSVFLMGTVVVLVLVISFGFIFSNNLITEKEELSLQIDIYKKLIKKKSDDYRLFRDFAMLNYVAENWELSVMSFENSLRLKIEQPEVLNNYAWLLLTCKDKNFHNKTEALKYSKLAWEFVEEYKNRSEVVFILDTLAEAYYQNNLFEEAFNASKNAKKFAKDNMEHYEKQYEKMKKARLKNSGFSQTI